MQTVIQQQREWKPIRPKMMESHPDAGEYSGVLTDHYLEAQGTSVVSTH